MGPQPETRPNVVKSLCRLLFLGDGFEKLAFRVLATKETYCVGEGLECLNRGMNRRLATPIKRKELTTTVTIM